MKFIGRKLYINWGNFVIAIEKLSGIKPEDIGMNKENPIKLYNIYEVLGERVESEVEGTINRTEYQWGQDLNIYLTDSDFWLTQEEANRQ